MRHEGMVHAGIRYRWARYVVLTLGCAGLFACSQRDVSLIDGALAPVSSAAETGRLELGLTSRSASGALYRLRQAQFQVFSLDPFGGFFNFLSSESDPLATSLETTLDIGDYQITLFSDWFLEKVQDGQVTRVQARLLSPESQNFGITANGETTVQYRFETNGEVIEFGQGRLIVQIEVQEQSSEPPPSDAVLGAPLEIVDGVISPDSNPNGISASFFAAAAPVGATIEVTSDTGAMCVRGSIAPVLNDDFATQWGSVFGLEFTSEPGVAAAWDLDEGNVTGFAFTVSGPDLPFTRFAALPGGADATEVNFCRPIFAASGESVQMPFDSLDRSCWLAVDDPLVATDLQNIAWNVVSDAAIAHTYDFCISDLRPILR